MDNEIKFTKPVKPKEEQVNTLLPDLPPITPLWACGCGSITFHITDTEIICTDCHHHQRFPV